MFQLWKNEHKINSYESLEIAQLVQSVIGGTIVALSKDNTKITGIVIGNPNYRTKPIYLKDDSRLNLDFIQRSTKKGRIGYVHQ